VPGEPLKLPDGLESTPESKTRLDPVEEPLVGVRDAVECDEPLFEEGRRFTVCGPL
jgi:hypothetical protein